MVMGSSHTCTYMSTDPLIDRARLHQSTHRPSTRTHLQMTRMWSSSSPSPPWRWPRSLEVLARRLLLSTDVSSSSLMVCAGQ